jgi:hypothetical protein
MHDGVNTRHSAADGGWICDVALDELAAPGRELRRLAGVTDEAAHREIAAPQLVRDVAAHEAAAPRDQDHPAGSFWKFCQYFDGVGPRWPWYFDPSWPVL